MGFYDTPKVIEALKATNGNLVNIIIM